MISYQDVEHTFQIVADSHYDINKDVYDENYDDFDLEYQQELELQYQKELGKKQNMFEFLVGESLHNYLNSDDLVDEMHEAQKKYIEVCLKCFFFSINWIYSFLLTMYKYLFNLIFCCSL